MCGRGAACTAGRDQSEPRCSGTRFHALPGLMSHRDGPAQRLLPIVVLAESQRQLLPQLYHCWSELLCADAGIQMSGTSVC